MSSLIFLQISQVIWMKCMLSQSFGLLTLMLNFLCKINIYGRDFYFHDFMRYVFDIGLHWDIGEPIS